MDDLIFGTLSTDDLRLVHYRAARRGLHHGYAVDPPDPLPGQPLRLTATAGPEVSPTGVAVYYTLDGSEPLGSRGTATRGQVLPLRRTESSWDVLVWGYVARWEASLPPLAEGQLLRYRVGAWRDDGPETFADWPDVHASTDAAARAHFRREPPGERSRGERRPGTIFEVRADRHRPPEWAVECVVYQVFVDRFEPGRGNAWHQTSDLRGFFGGTLWGVLERLDHIVDLGATCLWLTPIFPSPSPHGYDATDLEHVEPRLGGDAALRQLVQAAHDRGLRVVLDFVCNHISNRHPLFAEAQASPRSRYRDWFTFDDSPAGYRTYFGVAAMPQVNLDHPDARRWMIDAARYWLREFEVDGFRLDHAVGPGPGFWLDFYTACKLEKADSFCFGELVEPPYVQRQYLGRMDGTLDFHTAAALRDTYARAKWTEGEWQGFLREHLQQFPPPFLLLSFLDNHDMDRFLFVAGDDKERLRQAVRAQMRLPGPPVVYYGTEVGLRQTVGKGTLVGLDAGRLPMVWAEDQDRELLEFTRAAIRGRKEEKPWLRTPSA
jgi:glycosidase